ncbi:MAG TPA: hypothetical protein VNK95_15170 [Caldilineaceae bacterium]|nr:hypothetical protein [Caldilineaceae bacterium]
MTSTVRGSYERMPGWWAPPYVFGIVCDACGRAVEASNLAALRDATINCGWEETFHTRGNGGADHRCPDCAAVAALQAPAPALIKALNRWYMEPESRRLYHTAVAAGIEVRVRRLRLGNPYTNPQYGQLEDVTALYAAANQQRGETGI